MLYYCQWIKHHPHQNKEIATMKYTITTGGIMKSENGEYATWADAMVVWKLRCAESNARMSEAKRQLQNRVANGIDVAPISIPNRRNTWNDEPPTDE